MRNADIDTVVDTGIDTYVDNGSNAHIDTGMPQTKNDKRMIKNEKNDKEIKHIYGEYRHVRLTDAERDRLFNDYGEAEALEAIKYLDEYKERKGYKCQNDNLTLRKWVFNAVKEERKPTQGNVFDAWKNA